MLDLIEGHKNLVLVPTPGVPYRTMEYLRNPALLEHSANFDGFDTADRAFILATAQKDLAGAEGARAQRAIGSLPEKIRQLRSARTADGDRIGRGIAAAVPLGSDLVGTRGLAIDRRLAPGRASAPRPTVVQ